MIRACFVAALAWQSLCTKDLNPTSCKLFLVIFRCHLTQNRTSGGKLGINYDGCRQVKAMKGIFSKHPQYSKMDSRQINSYLIKIIFWKPKYNQPRLGRMKGWWLCIRRCLFKLLETRWNSVIGFVHVYMHISPEYKLFYQGCSWKSFVEVLMAT